MCSATSSVVAFLTVLCAPFQFSNRAAGEAAEFSRSGVELLGVVGTARLECSEPAAEAGELIRRQLGDSFGDFFDLHVVQYSRSGLGFAERLCKIAREKIYGPGARLDIVIMDNVAGIQAPAQQMIG